MSEIKPNKIINLVANSSIADAVRICAIKAASNITMPLAENDLKKLLKQILDNPTNPNWLNSILHYVVVNNQNIDWENPNYSDIIILQIIEACTVAINRITGN